MRKLTDCGVVDRRVLILYRVVPEVLSEALPWGVRALEIHGRAVAGIAFARHRMAKSRLLPARLVSSHTASHFVVVTGSQQSGGRDAALVTRCDCSSRFRLWIGGRPIYHHARFRVVEERESLELVGDSDDRAMHLSLRAHVVRNLPHGSIFRTPGQAMEFLRACAGELDLTLGGAVEMDTSETGRRLRLQPLKVERLESSIFENLRRGALERVEFDSAYWVRDDEFAWAAEGTLCCDIATA
ncbi:MAG: hypothetical protein ACYC0X_26110 [Pirellulaceae bacterium]